MSSYMSFVGWVERSETLLWAGIFRWVSFRFLSEVEGQPNLQFTHQIV